ncbi:MAG: response regulator [Chloroflexota bacterium]
MNKSATILLVEDDRIILEGLAELLELCNIGFCDIGYQIKTICTMNGVEGLSALYAHAPDLIISDNMMPKMDGFEFLRRVRANRSWAHIPFVFLAPRDLTQEIRAGRLTGVDGCFQKPFDSDELLQFIKSLLDRKFQQSDREADRAAATKRARRRLVATLASSPRL